MAKVNIPDEFYNQIKAIHPFPWTQVQYGNGLLQLADRNNVVVDLFGILNMCELVSKGAVSE